MGVASSSSGSSGSSSSSSGSSSSVVAGMSLPFGLSLPSVPRPELPTMPSVPPALVTAMQENAGPLLEQLRDPSSQLRHRLPALGTLSRRFGTECH